MRTSNRFRLLAVPLVSLFAILLVACDGEDRPDVDVVDGGSATGSGSVSGSASGSATGAPIGPGSVEDRPAGATQVDVTLREWQVSTSVATVEAGEIYFLAENAGPDDAHEFVIIRTDLAPGDLPTDEGKVPEDGVDLIDEIEPFTPGSRASITVNLEAGSYALICNITEIEDGELESHYKLGMWTAFTVE